MALFNLSDIVFNNAKGATGPLKNLAQSGYESNTFRYPIDLGSSDKAHYIVFNINEQRMTSYPGSADKSVTPTTIANNLAYGNQAAGVTAINQNIGAATTAVLGVAESIGTKVSGVIGNFIPASASALVSDIGSAVMSNASAAANALQTSSIRAERRIKDTVALYMPDTLTYAQNQKYDTPGAGGQALTAIAAAGKSVIDTINSSGNSKEKINSAAQNLSPFIASMLAKAAGNLGQIAFSQAYGVVQNPMLEVLYSSPEFRTFRFDFMFYPRSEKEAEIVQKIIARFRFHQAPEINTSFGNGFFMVPPSEFDISFYYNGTINPNIPKISTCVMESMDVDYAPNGFSAYEVPGEKAQLGRTGMPVAIRMSLQFKETEIMTKTAFDGQDNSGLATRYGTEIGSQQTSMLAEQERGMN